MHVRDFWRKTSFKVPLLVLRRSFVSSFQWCAFYFDAAAYFQENGAPIAVKGVLIFRISGPRDTYTRKHGKLFEIAAT
jgi:hypothetical protein